MQIMPCTHTHTQCTRICMRVCDHARMWTCSLLKINEVFMNTLSVEFQITLAGVSEKSVIKQTPQRSMDVLDQA